MEDWIHAGLPVSGRECYAWMEDGSVRRVLRSRETGVIHFTDCTSPAQNCCCAPDSIKAWRLGDGALNPPLTPDQIAENEALQRRAMAYNITNTAYPWNFGCSAVWPF